MLENDRLIFLDGAMGTMLQKLGLERGEKPEMFAFEHPEAVMEVHKSYIESGSDIIYANTFGANRFKMADAGKSVEKIISNSVNIALKAAEGRAKVALDVGPLGEMLEPNGSLSFEEAYDAFREQVIAGEKAGCDLIVIETMTDLGEARAAALAAKENTSLPVIVTMSFEKNGRTFSGCSAACAAIALTALGVDAVGINCSLGPDEIYPIAREMSENTHLPIVVKANAGLPDPQSGEYNITPEAFAEAMLNYVDLGIKLVGGCCGTSPEYIASLKKAFSNAESKKRDLKKRSVVCTASEALYIDGIKVIGERINPTGKKALREALKNNDMDYILTTAVAESEAGCHILDINVGTPGINEAEMMARCVKAIQSVTSLPLQIDSTLPDAIEAGLRVYNGKAIVNSVNGEDKVLDAILPIVKKYGAAVVGLTLDDNGIPKTWQERVTIAKKILKRAEEYGIAKEDVFIDTLTLTVSTEQKGMYETLKALKYIREEMGLKTVLGVSNISFGLPQRQKVNCAFLTLAMEYGLTMPILNPNDEMMMGAVYAFGALSGSDKDCRLYTEKMAEAPLVKTEEKEETLEGAVIKGLRGEAAKKCAKLLENKTELEVVNEHLIPALDVAGERFEKGEFFLPQLLGAANAAKEAFEVIKASLDKKGNGGVKKGKIILATVKGDVHDIGKNIVKVILENYGYEVIDLGKDVKKEDVVECAKREGVKLIGLSALMTTTLKSMEEAIELIRESGVAAKVMCGGAVLTEEYAKAIDADYYAKDAKRAADIAKEVFGT